MQHRESFVRRSNENRDPHGSAFIGNRKQSLYAGNVADAHAQAAVLLIDLGHPVGVDRLLNAHSYTMLVDVEEQQLFKGWSLLCS